MSDPNSRSTDLTEEEKVKLRVMAADWEKYHIAVRMLAWFGSVLRYAIGLGLAIASLWGYLHGNAGK